ncbi:PAS domain S-box-containing protein [Azospirillum fermentarium]|uniref:PAS-domain containing protein n=1 Tax=Azospirillum fermentarium TaxID=1233114 RepID=UPI0022267CE3|nr:PAS-domain containing protein [Azospirillum fermentarium]MCW2245313.1 PAS domain S-box-containing protein [Azospirillum fermentarium]
MAGRFSLQRILLMALAGGLAMISFIHTVTEAYKDGMDEAVFALAGIVSAFLLAAVLFRQEKQRLVHAREAVQAADARLESANRRMVEAVEVVSEGFALFDPADRLVHCNRHYRNLYPLTDIREGMTFEELIRNGAAHGQYAACPPGDIEPWIAERMAHHRNPGASFEQELDGGRWLRVSEWRTSDGGYVGIRTDITEHKRREAELAEKTELLETVFAAMTQGVAVWAANGQLLTWNRRFSEMLDLPPGWLRPGRTKKEMLRLLAERGEFGPGSPEALVNKRLVTLGPKAAGGRTEHRRPDGTVLERTVVPVAGGRTMLVSYTDISAFRRVETDLRESEERFRQLSDAATDAIVMHEAGIVMDANAAACTLLGLAAGQLVGRPVLSLIAPEDIAKASQRLRDHSETPFELTCRRADGTRLLVEGRTRYVAYRGRMVGIVSARDITETRRTQEQMRAAKEQAELASKAKSEFLRTISHEIRTPMNGVLGTLGLLLDGELDEQQRIYATTARESGEALLAILNDILDLSKMEAGRLALEEHRFHLVELVESVVELLSARATAKGITLAACVPAQVPVSLRGDAGRLRQILLNLAGNAVKFTESGGVSVTVELAAPHGGPSVDGGGPVHLHFRITDTGIGIAPDALPSLFTEFTQVDPQPSRRHGGTGLGLAICKRLVQLMGGRIGVESTLGRGSVFWFTVPLHRQPGDAAGQGGGLTARLSGRRILLLDPSPIGRDTMAAQLRSWGAHVDATGDTAAALRLAGTAPIDMALVDGDERALPNLIGALRGAGVRRIIRLTMVGQHCDGLPAGTDALVIKPVRQRRLLDVLEGKPGDSALPPPRPARLQAAAVAGRRLLLAEDSPTNQLVAASFLKAAGYQVDVAANGLEAVEAARTLPYDLILMDLAMPEMDGLTAARTLRTMPAPIGVIPIIAMTADAMPGDRDRCLASGMNDYVPKPVDRALLLETVARWLPAHPAVSGTEPDATPPAGPDAPGGAEDDSAERLDTHVLKQLTDDLDAALLAEVLHQFMEETRIRARRIAETDDPKLLARDAHTLKSTAATFGATVLSAKARALEDACRNGPADEVERLRARIPDLVESAADAYRATGLLT